MNNNYEEQIRSPYDNTKRRFLILNGWVEDKTIGFWYEKGNPDNLYSLKHAYKVASAPKENEDGNNRWSEIQSLHRAHRLND